MFDNVVVGVDGRPGGHDAVALARQLASADARVALANIYGPVDGPPGGTAAQLPEELAAATELLEHERERSWPTADTVHVCSESVGKALHQVAERREADLLVVGSSRHGFAGKVFLGDDTRAAFNGSPCAIAIAPHGYALGDRRLDVIGVGYDAEPESELALAAARELAQRTGATIDATWVITHEDVGLAANLPADWPSATTELVKRAQAQLDAMEGIDGHAVYGGPREELTRLAGRADLLIVGSRGYGPLARVFHGSVSSYLQRHAGSALLVLARDAVAAEQAPDADAAGEEFGPVGWTAVARAKSLR